MVPGIGPKPCSIAFVGEAPGYHEVKRGVPFVGPSGKEFDRYIRIPRLRRENIYITNLIKVAIPQSLPELRSKDGVRYSIRNSRRFTLRSLCLWGDCQLGGSWAMSTSWMCMVWV